MALWEAHEIPVPLKVIDSPYREITRPVLDYVMRARSDNPRNVVTVFIPEYVVGHWWEQFLHNQSALRLKGRLLFEPGVMVTSVPWQLRSSTRLPRREPITRGAVRWGMNPDGTGSRTNTSPTMRAPTPSMRSGERARSRGPAQ